MMAVHINPDDVDDEYLACLNACFQPWGDMRAFSWYFRRASAYQAPDLIVIKRENRLIAGSAVTYRRLELPGGSFVDVGIMTGSWTLPEARGQGCFTQIIETSMQLATMRNGMLLLAFVTEENRSCRVLARAGATLIPSSYCFSDQQELRGYSTDGVVPVEKNEGTIRGIWKWMRSSHLNAVRFSYHSEHEVAAQFVDRSGSTEILGDRMGNLGIIERKGDTDLVQVLIPTGGDEDSITAAVASFLRRSLVDGRKFFLYSTQAVMTQACRQLGCGVKRGYIAVLVADPIRWRAVARPVSTLDVQASTPADRADPLLGPWCVHGGDRA